MLFIWSLSLPYSCIWCSSCSFCFWTSASLSLKIHKYLINTFFYIILTSNWPLTVEDTSHARTVVRECCKGDEGEIWPLATQKPLNRWSPKFVYVTTSGISTTTQNFIQIGLGVSVLRMRDFAPQSDGYFLGFLRKATADTRAPISTQNTSNDVVPRKEVPFGGRETKI